ncbi:alpha/beta fold hydrolase [Novosphingobium terrae]|uniref:alpha/beta fold hydrolase n=1 Tax=Novosphingobium terrae TaxID=2726189 RepID=UPI00197FFCF6|nr:alpha/beta hydrolase [Novosphingobium terrae]
MPIARVQDLALAYDSFGDSDAPALLLIAGLGTQMIRWTEPFCNTLAACGLHVIRFDNRDSGLSTHSDAPAPDVAAMMAGRPISLPYRLTDMAQDAIGLLDALGIAQAHVVGRSMGGMIAQIIASLWPQRVLSLTSIMASSGNPALPPPAPEVMAMLMGPSPDPRQDEAGFLAHRLAFARKIASPTLPFDETGHRALALAELHRGWQPGATTRQMAAIAMDGDRRPRLAAITAPALVIHGSADPLFPLPHGQDTAGAIPHARFMPLEGMGHDLPPPFHAAVIEAITQTCRQTR